MQNILILVIVSLCAVYIGRRLYRNIRNGGGSCSCECSCSDCGPDIANTCSQKKE